MWEAASPHRRGLRALRAAMVAALAAFAPLFVPAEGVAATTLAPAADAYVTAAFPSKNFGSRASLSTSASPAKWTYLRFEVGGLTAPVAHATLRMYALTTLSAPVVARRVATNAWDEATIVYGNAPGLGIELTRVPSVTKGTWTSFDVTALVSGNGTYSVALTTPGSGANVSSRESTRPPQLVIETEQAAPSAPTGFTLTARTATSISTSWQPSSLATGYDVYRNGTKVGSTAGTRYTVSGLTCGTSYTLGVDAVGSSGLASPPATLTASTSACATSASVYWGAWIGSQLTGTEAPWDMNAVSLFEQEVGKRLSLVNFSSPFANCYVSPCSFYPFPTAAMEAIRRHGAIPFFSWASDSLPVSTNEPAFQLADVTGGTYDSYIRSFATAAKGWGHPFFLRFNWEMNGNWFPWAERANGNRPGDYVAAWRHVHDLFSSVGATNVSWVWCPNIDPSNQLQPLAGLYPGDDYVDWTCLDGYNWASPWSSFDQLYRSTYTLITTQIAPSKPLAIGEVASTEQGGSKAAWIGDLLTTQLPQNYPKVKALLWFDKYDSSMEWPIESSNSATAAFAAAIQAPYYAGSDFAAIAASPIPSLP